MNKSINLSNKKNRFTQKLSLKQNRNNNFSINNDIIFSDEVNFSVKETNKVTETLKSNNNNHENNETELKVKIISIFRIFFHLNRPIDYFLMFLGIIGNIGSGISLPIQIYLSSELISDIGNTSEIISSEENKMMNIVEKSFNNKIKRLLIFGTISFLCNFLSFSFWNIVSQRDIHHLKYKYFSVILRQEQAWFDKINAFELRAKVQIQLEKIEQGIGERFGNILSNIFQSISGFIIAFINSWKLTLVILCIFPLIVLLMFFFLNSIKLGKILSRKKNENVGGIAEEILYNIKTVASFANFEFEIKRYNEMLEEYYNLELKNIYKLGVYIGTMMFLLYSSMFISLLYGRTLIEKEYNWNKKRNFTGGDVINVSFCTLMGVMSINSMIPNIKSVQEACTSSLDYFNLIERKMPMDFSFSNEKPDISKVKGEIIFKNVEFKYPSNKNKNILNKINLIFESGKKIAIVGESGSGKSTIVNLIERLYEVDSGEILIDNIDIKKYDIHYLRALIGYVQQEPILFNKSIKENIIFGREKLLKNKNIDDLIKKVCDDSDSTEFIEKLPGKLNYLVGVKGNKLSGGQKQRIAIARALLLSPKILILDEATSALDKKSEKEVQIALDKIYQNKNITIIIIAHHSSAINYSDIIYKIQNGKGIKIEKGHKSSNKTFYSKPKQNKNENIHELNTSIEILNVNNDDDKQIHSKNGKKKEIKFQIKRIFLEISNKKFNMILAFISAIIVGGLNPIIGVMLGNSINGINSKYENIRYNKGLKYGLLFLLIAFLQGIGNIIMNWQFMILGANLVKSYRKKVFEKFLNLHLSFYDLESNSPGSLLTRLSNDANQLNSLMLSILGYTSICISIFIVGLIIGCLFEYRLTLISLSFIPFIILSNILTKILKKTINQKARDLNAEAGGFFSECVINTKTIYCFNFQNSAVDYYMEIINFLKNNIIYDSLISGFCIGFGKFCIFAANATIFYSAKKYILKRQINSENLSIIINVIITMIIGIGQGFGRIANLKNIKNAYNSLYNILDSKKEILNYKKDNETKNADNIKGKIEFKNVSFAYPTRPEQKILDNVSFIIEPGEHAAIVGHSGSGKSTIFQLLERFYDIEDGNGEILIDNENIKNYDLYKLRKRIGLVPQEPILFKRNALENIRYGKLDASDEECLQAAKYSNFMEFNNALYNINENEEEKYCFSGGEKQKMAIARIFLKNPKILMLDEITSSLDKNNVLTIQESLKKIIKNKTTISISHRLSTIENCNIIFFLNNGKIEKGTYQELMKLKKEYYLLDNE